MPVRLVALNMNYDDGKRLGGRDGLEVIENCRFSFLVFIAKLSCLF